MKHEPRVYRFAGNPNWIGSFYEWHVEGQRWVRVRRSTECTQKRAAMGVVEEWHRLAQAVAGGTTISRERALASVNLILRAAGVPEVVETQTWETYSRAWLEMRRKSTAERTHEAYRSHVKTFDKWLEGRVKWALSKFDGMLLQAFYDTLLEEGRSPKTAKNIIKTLAMIFDRARAEGLCLRNAVELVERVHAGDVDRPREVFTWEEEAKVLRYLEKRRGDPEMADWLTMTHLGIATGRRLMDCAGAGWQQFEEEGKGQDKLLVWTLRPLKLRRKGKVERVPIRGAAADYLRDLRKRATGLFLCPEVVNQKKLSGAYIAILKVAGVKVGKVAALGWAGNEWQTKGFHSWRHTLTTRLAEAGVEQRLGKRITGHSSDKVHEGYTHLELATLARSLDRALDRAL